MKNHKTEIKGSLVCFSFILFLLSVLTPILVKGSDLVQDETVQIGQWKISNGIFHMDQSPVWTGSARNNNESININIYQDPNQYKSQNSGVEVNISGVKESVFNVEQPLYARQQKDDPLEEELLHSLVCIYNQQKFLFRRTVKYTRESGTSENKAEFIQDCINNALPKVSSDTLVLFAKLFFSNEIQLGQNLTNNTDPAIEASIDNKEYIKLNQSQAKKFYSYGWELPARPGQNIKFRMQLDTYEITATTYGLTTRYGREFSQDRIIYIDNRETFFNSDGIAELDYGKIEGPELLLLKYRGWKDHSSWFRGNIYLRWGRPEEKWLDDNNNFPLAEQVTNPTIDNCIRNLLHDLNIAYDWDRSCWIEYSGDRNTQYQPDYDDIKVLEGLNLKGFPKLKEIKEKYDNEVSETTLVQARNLMNTLLDTSKGEVLWKEITPFGNEPSGWHSPSRVFELAYIYKEFTKLRKDNPIEKVLDFWVDSMKDSPDPVGYYTKGGIAYTDNLNLRAYSIVALNLGYELFKKPEYKEACDIQVKRFREYLQEKGILDSILNLNGLKEKDFGYTPEIGRQMCEAVSLYGQVCILTGDKEGLKQAQEWIKTALTREGTPNENAFRNYESATFKDRCGFIAVLRGKSTFSELPLKKAILLN